MPDTEPPTEAPDTAAEIAADSAADGALRRRLVTVAIANFVLAIPTFLWAVGLAAVLFFASPDESAALGRVVVWSMLLMNLGCVALLIAGGISLYRGTRHGWRLSIGYAFLALTACLMLQLTGAHPAFVIGWALYPLSVLALLGSRAVRDGLKT